MMKKISIFFLIALSFLTATSCSQKEEELLFDLKVVPSESFVIPGKTWSCLAPRDKGADVDGPYVLFGFDLTNKSAKFIRIHYFKITARSSAIEGGKMEWTFSRNTGTDDSVIAPQATETARGGLAGSTCLDPLAGIKFKNPKTSATLNFTWRFYFTIESEDGLVQEPYQQEGESTATYLGDN